MAISLKNVDDRLKVLENKLTGSVIGFPDWSKMTKLKGTSNNYTYTAKTSIWILIFLKHPAQVKVYLNDIYIANAYSFTGQWVDCTTCILPINSGDKIRTDQMNNIDMWEIPIKL